MTADPTTHDETELELIDGALADLGAIHRRASSQTLPEADFRELMTRVRSRLRVLRAAHLGSDEPALVLTDAGMSAADAIEAAGVIGQRPEIRELIRRAPGLMTARSLIDNPAVMKARFHGPLAVIDGGRP